MEIERKFLLDEIPMFLEKENPNILITNIKQTYLSFDPEVRIRRVFTYFNNKEGQNSYYMTIKSDGEVEREELEFTLTIDEYQRLATNALLVYGKDYELDKDYYRFKLTNDVILECSVVDKNTNRAFMYAEVEFNSFAEAQKFKKPHFLGKEITSNPSYKMKNYFVRTRQK